MNASSPLIEGILSTALHLMAQHKLADAFKLLKRADQLEPDNAAVLYLLGVVRMQMGTLEPALELMRRAVQIEPTLYAAHFHLGFLLFNEDREVDAAQAWQQLAPLGEDHPLVLFTQGVQAWARDDFEACRRYLQRGLELNSAQDLFNAEMRQILAWANEEEKEQRGEDDEGDVDENIRVEKTSTQVRKSLKLPNVNELKVQPRLEQEKVSLLSRMVRNK